MITQYSQMRWSGPDWDLKFEGELQGYTSPKALGLKGAQVHLPIKAAQMGQKSSNLWGNVPLLQMDSPPLEMINIEYFQF